MTQHSVTNVLVAVHDVTPALAPAVDRLWELCAERGVTPALLVVPDWHGAWPRHDEHALPRRWVDEVRAFGRTEREGEFLTLGRLAARARIGEGPARLRALGLEPLGLVPPAWLARDGWLRAVAAGIAARFPRGSLVRRAAA